jgi:Flp pilus assembly protein TadB
MRIAARSFQTEVRRADRAANGGRPYRSDELDIASLMIVAGIALVIGALVRGGSWGVSPTLGVVLAALGARMVVTVFVLRRTHRVSERTSTHLPHRS